MSYIIPLEKITFDDRAKIGAKSFRLADLARMGFSVPKTICLTTDAYDDFINQDGLRERIQMILHRKHFRDMRWEEIWDASLRIRNMFLGTSMPPALLKQLTTAIKDNFPADPIVVRSSSPDEDSQQQSFAGLHESYVNVSGIENILDRVKLVWASLWSDAALLYRQELDLQVERSAMAVILQSMVLGETSGVFFSHHPTNQAHTVVEAVYGLNQGLVDGEIEPDRWVLKRDTGGILSHTPAERKYLMIPKKAGTVLQKLQGDKKNQSPLTPQQLAMIYKTGMAVVEAFQQPQDIEWTFSGERLVILQARPISTRASKDSGDKRAWYLSLHRSFENLKELRDRIKDELIPEMKRVAMELADIDLSRLDAIELLGEIDKRKALNDHWIQIYWRDFIPFAHGIRLFGQYYNDTVRPQDPYEFMLLLEQTDLKSVSRNKQLEALADQIQNDRSLADHLKNGVLNENHAFYKDLTHFIGQFGDLSCPVTGGVECVTGEQGIIAILLEMASHPIEAEKKKKHIDLEELYRNFLLRVDDDKRGEAREILMMGRISYQLRDDDNIYLGRIESCLLDAVKEAQARLNNRTLEIDSEVRQKLETHVAAIDYGKDDTIPRTPSKPLPRPVKFRQIVGQPAGPGIAKGRARVIHRHNDLLEFKHGEILVCESVDPNMTFVIPLAKAVVEKRGGMLIHGAIIAREYGLPCVTGVPDAHRMIRTGDDIVVDGYLGMVTIDN